MNAATRTTTYLAKKPMIKGLPKIKKILIIEDDQDTSDLIAHALRSRYLCTTQVAQDPFEAINLITENFYDLIILDWQLPGLSGTDTLATAEKSLKLEPSLPVKWGFQKVPVVIFSSAKKNECPPRRTKHFNYVGYVSKTQPLSAIVEAFGEYILDERSYHFLTA